MLKDELSTLAAFVAVAEAGSFTRAAGKLGLSQSGLSHAIKRLEARLGVRLLARTTRSVVPTDAGAQLLETLRPSLQSIESNLAALANHRDRPAGVVRITSADHVAERIVWPALRAVLIDYPEITVELNVENGFVNIIEERYDAGIRLGNNIEKDMIAVPIGPEERLIVVASPDYLRRHAAPILPNDLTQHTCINRRLPTLGGFSAWHFEKAGRTERIRVAGRMASNRPDIILDAACSGLGLASVLETQALEPLARGDLVEVLDDWSPTLPGYHLYYPSRHQNAAALQLVINALRYRPGP